METTRLYIPADCFYPTIAAGLFLLVLVFVYGGL
jgi:hypothetical protein